MCVWYACFHWPFFGLKLNLGHGSKPEFASIGAMWGFSPHLIGMLLAPPVAFGDIFCFFLLSQKRLLQVPEPWFDTTKDTFETFDWDEFCVDSLRLSIGQCSIRAYALLIA